MEKPGNVDFLHFFALICNILFFTGFEDLFLLYRCVNSVFCVWRFVISGLWCNILVLWSSGVPSYCDFMCVRSFHRSLGVREVAGILLEDC